MIKIIDQRIDKHQKLRMFELNNKNLVINQKIIEKFP